MNHLYLIIRLKKVFRNAKSETSRPRDARYTVMPTSLTQVRVAIADPHG